MPEDDGEGGGSPTPTATSPAVSPASAAPTPPGNGITFESTDADVLISSSSAPPSITSTAGATFTVGRMGSFTVTATGNPTPSLSESSASPAGVTVQDNGDGTASLSGTPAAGTGGVYHVTITASNGVSPNATQSLTLTVQAPPRATIATALAGARYTRGHGGPARTVLHATVLATLAMDELTHLGSARRAIDLATRALAAHLPVQPHRGESWAVLALATLVAADELDAARGGTDEILVRGREQGAAVTVATISALRALIGLRTGELADAEADAYTAIELASDLLGRGFLVLAVAAAVLAGLERGARIDSLRRLLECSGVAFDPDFLPGAQLLYATGALRAAAGNHETAVEALTLASACGARVIERRVRTELAATGHRPPPAGRTGTDALTPSERHCVELAAAGSTNREIAQKLFVTEKTVETHLGRAFRKLGVSSRRQLADVPASAP